MHSEKIEGTLWEEMNHCVTLRIIWHRILPAIWHRERFAKAPWTNWHHWINLMPRAL